MKYKWLNRNESDKLILFFNGWGMDDNVVSHMNCDGYDIVVFYDYNNLDTDIELSNYKEKYVVGWSMGVMVSILDEVKHLTSNAKKRIAICGTPFPVNNDFGIPEKIYNMTIRGFNELSSEKFISRMFMGGFIPEIVTNRTIESQKAELVKLLEYRQTKEVRFDTVIIAEKDVIIPTKNQMNYWTDKDVNIMSIDSGHCPFLMYNSWTELVEGCKKV